jgi:hypothetical protein
VTYDVAVWESGLEPGRWASGPSGTYWGTLVYERDGLSGTVHRVESPLKPNTIYFWSVRTRQGNDVESWSTYDGWWAAIGLVGGGMRGEVHGSPFMFQTPTR